MLPTTLQLSGRRFKITRAESADVPELVELLADDVLGAQREHASLQRYQQAFDEISADPKQLLATVRDAADALVGTMQLTLIPGLSRGGAKRLQIEAVRMAPSVRGSGLGSAMLDWAHKYGRAHGAALAQLTADRRRTDAHRFYERLGYQASHEGYKLPL